MDVSPESGSLIRVLVVDDQHAAQLGLEALLSTLGDIEVIGHAGNGREAVQIVDSESLDLILMDGRMPVMDGFEATRAIKEQHPEIAVIVYSIYGNLEKEAAAAGADAFLVKGCSADDLISTIRTVTSRLQGSFEPGNPVDGPFPERGK